MTIGKLLHSVSPPIRLDHEDSDDEDDSGDGDGDSGGDSGDGGDSCLSEFQCMKL